MKIAFLAALLCTWVHGEQATQRIASFSPAATRILIDLGCEDRVVAVTRWCELPPKHPAVRTCDAFEPDLEALLKSGATVAIIPRLANPLLENRIRTAGLRTLILNQESLESPAEDIQMLGQVTGQHSRTQKLLEERTAFKNPPQGKRVLIIWDGVCAGPRSYLAWAIRAAGAEPAPLQGAWPLWDVEEVIRGRPDIVIFLKTDAPTAPKEDTATLEKWRREPGLKSTPAAQKGSIFHLKANSDWLPASGQPQVARIIIELMDK